ncbi:MAG: cobyric acid synthase CobQ, partial [Hyphomicrobiales bacterium]
QVVVQGRRLTSCAARDYAALKPKLLPAVLESFAIVSQQADLVLVEGAGSPAEVNLRAGDIANLGFAAKAGIPALLAGDIDRGGVIAALVGTHALLEPDERALIQGFLINKFRGDPALFEDANTEIARRTGWPALGIMPWFEDASFLPAEDSLDLESRTPRQGGNIRVAVLKLSRIANFDDLNPLSMEPGLRLDMIKPGQPVPGDCHLVIIPGSKSTLADLEFLKANGWDVDIRAHLRRGGHVLGLCGGYQMLGRRISDAHGIEGARSSAEGLGLLDVETVLTPDKSTHPATGIHAASGLELHGYEIHLGHTEGPDRERPFLRRQEGSDGACSTDGRICGTYMHGLFSDDAFRRTFLANLGAAPSTGPGYEQQIEQTLDRLAAHMERHLDLDRILRIAQSHAHNPAASADTNSA